MKPLDRDLSILRHIVTYCSQINMAIERFGNDYSTFDSDPVYRNSVSLCILQIGELVGNLSDDFKADNPAVPWRQIKRMRNIVAHRYGTVDNAITWEVVQKDIPELSEYCRKLLSENQK